MLNEKQVKQEIKSRTVKGAEKKFLEWVQKSPAKLKPVGFVTLGRKLDGKQSNYYESDDLEEAAILVTAMSDVDRRKLFKGLFGKLAPQVEAGWDALETTIYQSGYGAMMPFRFKKSDGGQTLACRRMDWVSNLFDLVKDYDGDIVWFATWHSYLNYYGNSAMGILFAAAIDQGGADGDKVFEILKDAASGVHEIAGMDRHIPIALLSCRREDGWEFIEKMLLAAQRQEGLRQSILETVDIAQPKAFLRMLKLILDENLVRFSAVVRAVDCWFGLRWDSVSAGVVKSTMQRALVFLEDPKARKAALAGGEAEDVYLALWAIAFSDALGAVAPAKKLLLKHKDPAVRFAAAILLHRLDTPEASEALVKAIHDDDLRVVEVVLHPATHRPSSLAGDLFDDIEKLYARYPDKPVKAAALVWPWMEFTYSKRDLWRPLLGELGKRPVNRLFPYLKYFEPWGREQVAGLLKERRKLDPESRAMLFTLLKDSSGDVRSTALEAVRKLKLSAADHEEVEGLLTRKAADLRRGVLSLLNAAKPDDLQDSAARLMGSKNGQQREAGLELLRMSAEEGRDAERCIEAARAFAAGRKKLTAGEKLHLDAIVTSNEVAQTLDDALGLMNPENMTLAPPPAPKGKVKLSTPAAIAVLESLDKLVHEHRKAEFEATGWNDEKTTEMIGTAAWAFPTPDRTKPRKGQEKDLPLREVWESWVIDRPKSQRDADGLELFRALALCDDDTKTPAKKDPKWEQDLFARAYGKITYPKLKYEEIVDRILHWLVQPSIALSDFIIELYENELAAIDFTVKVKQVDDYNWEDKKTKAETGPLGQWEDWREFVATAGIGVNWVGSWLTQDDKFWRDQHLKRAFELGRWSDRPTQRVKGKLVLLEVAGRERVDNRLFAAAFKKGIANNDDAYDHFLGTRGSSRWGGEDFSGLSEGTQRRREEWLKGDAKLQRIVTTCRDKVLEMELTRGDQPTIVTKAASSIRSLPGADYVFAILAALGKTNLHRTYSYSSESKHIVFSELLRSCYPLPSDDPADFAKRVKAEKIPEQRLIQVALFVPQFIPHVAAAIGWAGFDDAAWWVLAHTKDDSFNHDEDDASNWKREIEHRTRLASKDLSDGAVDVDWFSRTYAQLKKAKWEKVLAEARFASTGNGHKRAEVFAKAMIGGLKKTDMVKRIKDKRHQDTVRAIGLLPLAGGKGRDNDVLSRYQLLQEFVRTSRQFGSQRQTSEKRAAAIGQDNLARTAGYPDPIRLQWDMEAREIEDMADGKITVVAGEVEVTLAIDALGMPVVSVIKNGKALKSIPAATRKNKEVKALTERRTALKRQASRTRKSLEMMMCRGDLFSGAELVNLLKHPILAPMLNSLVLVGDSGTIGYPEKAGKMLRDHSGSNEIIGKKEELRIAHPDDLLKSKAWSKWQRECLGSERIQPFKQVFRELYPLTPAEKKGKGDIKRYAGHQINPSQAMALFGSRGWLASPEEGMRKTFHDDDLTAYVTFEESFYTPAEVEGLTLSDLRFCKRNTWKPVPPKNVPPRLFSEAMRDLDLVVSVAHRGGVDPEASASTIEMRRQLLAETTAVLDLKNVKTKGAHVSIKGEFAEYTVHLGSAMTHVNPGGALFIVPVHAQHRGRLFLPFADDDPKTAEVMSKVLLLARDKEIKDPSILDQIRSLRK